MELIEYLPTLLFAGAVAGFLAGLLGIGGGAITVPVLFLAFADMGVPQEWRMHAAVATSLGAIVATNISSVYAHNKKGAVDWSLIKVWWPFILLMSVVGSFFAKSLKTDELVYVFAGLIGLLALKMFIPIDKVKLGEEVPGGLHKVVPPSIIAFFSAIVGIGGGSFTVPYLTLYSVPIHRAIGTSAMLGFFISIAGGAGYLYGGWGIDGLPQGMLGFIHVPSMAIVAVAAVLVAPIGAKAAHALPKKALSIVFGLFLLAAAIRMVLAV